eukprot:3530733-Lingulodinium_polyedra.AAC.1
MAQRKQIPNGPPGNTAGHHLLQKCGKRTEGRASKQPDSSAKSTGLTWALRPRRYMETFCIS